MKKNFYWIHREYSPSLTYISQRLVEYHTANLCQQYNVHYSYNDNNDGISLDTGTIFLDEAYTVVDSHIVNSLLNYNVYFKINTEDELKLDRSIEGLDVVVSLAAGELTDNALKKLTRYVIDISPMAIEKSKQFLDVPESNFYQLDIFDIVKVQSFLRSITGTIGIFNVSNCFLYIPNCLLFDVQFRIAKQNQFINCLKNDTRTWYVNMVSATGEHYNNVNVKDIPEIKITDQFKVLPWIS